VPGSLPRLIALSPGALGPGTTWGFLAALARAHAAGLPGLCLREPGLSDRAYLELARAVLALRGERPLWFAVHDRAHLAGELCADALHLSFRSLRPGDLAWRDPGLALGLSTHAHDDPRDWCGVDYLFHGPLNPTAGKTVALEPLGLAGLARARALTSLPVLALGGVKPADAGALRAAGLHGVAVRAGILLAEDPARAVRAYLEALE
jgi:thiamine-phosphate diphosphorylase